MIKPKDRKIRQRQIRNWAKKHKEEVYDVLGRVCNKCGTADDLTIHHKEYEVGLEFLEILCQKCHRKFHDKETKKRLLMLTMDEIKKFSKSDSIMDLEKWLQERINNIKVKIIPNIKMDGFEK